MIDRNLTQLFALLEWLKSECVTTSRTIACGAPTAFQVVHTAFQVVHTRNVPPMWSLAHPSAFSSLFWSRFALNLKELYRVFITWSFSLDTRKQLKTKKAWIPPLILDAFRRLDWPTTPTRLVSCAHQGTVKSCFEVHVAGWACCSSRFCTHFARDPRGYLRQPQWRPNPLCPQLGSCRVWKTLKF